MSNLISPSLVARLSQVSDRIRRANEELGTALGAVESYLCEFEYKVAATAWVDAPEGPFRLSFGPHGKSGQWRLLIEKVRLDATGKRVGEIETAWPVIEAPKAVLTRAAGEIPNLIEGIAAAAIAEADRLEAALAAIKGPADEVTIVDQKTREKLDRDFLELYSRRMNEEVTGRAPAKA